ncbi:dimethylaniline monooxygenase [N-oxide-forming] 2-like [Tubulanus polymorphus]|uniref:dimethylaniline monooxygenase [N-oxide-forming] 2-like n=1 Tax=Tubulanus polymorphus TaxID=672921 RepID=UPI003DA604C5
MSKKKVAIIGAGISGLSAIKSCLEERLDPVCFEQLDDIGGIWHYTDDCRPNQGASAYESLVTNTSKEVTCFSDYPHAPEKPNYLTYADFFEYLNSYADHFDLRKYVRFETQVTLIEKAPDHEYTGKWTVQYTSKSHQHTETFDCVMICIGRNRKPIYPDIQGRETFKGILQHGIEFRSGKRQIYRDKNILVIGNAHSAGDMATACSEHAKKVVLAIGRGTTLLSRYINGLPIDTTIRRILLWVPGAIVNANVKRIANAHIDHEKYGLKQPPNVIKGPICLNETLPDLIRNGSVAIKYETTRIDERGAEFNDGSRHDFDVIIMATGYDFEYDFIDPAIITDSHGRLKLYRLVWPIGETHSTLAIIGAHLNRGASAVASLELQGRWASAVFAGQLKLPTADVMEQEFLTRTRKVGEMFGDDRKTMPASTVLEFQDELASEIGSRPSFFRLLFREPFLAWQVLFGPAFNVQYRLLGRHAWKGAPEACRNAFKRVLQSRL